MKSTRYILIAICWLLTLTSCEDSDSSNVNISITPGVPVVQNYPYNTGGDDSESLEAPWFAYVLKFENGSDKYLIIQKVEISYRIGDQLEFSAPEKLKSIDDDEDYFLDISPGVGGLEYELIGGTQEPFSRYKSGMELHPSFPKDFNYYFKLVATGYFSEPGTAYSPIREFKKTIYFRTKGPDL